MEAAWAVMNWSTGFFASQAGSRSNTQYLRNLRGDGLDERVSGGFGPKAWAPHGSATYTGVGKTAYRLKADWDEFAAGKHLQQVFVTLEEVPPGSQAHDDPDRKLREMSGTALSCVKRGKAFSHCSSLFPLRRSRKTMARIRVSSSAFSESEVINHEAVVADIQSEVLQHLHATVELEVDKKGRARWRFFQEHVRVAKGLAAGPPRRIGGIPTRLPRTRTCAMFRSRRTTA